jgi:hypothetical protein
VFHLACQGRIARNAGLIVGSRRHGLIDLDQGRSDRQRAEFIKRRNIMAAFATIRDKFARFANAIAGLQQRAAWAEFECSDCERRERCGLPPDRNCVVKAAQIAREGGRPRRKRAALTQC